MIWSIWRFSALERGGGVSGGMVFEMSGVCGGGLACGLGFVVLVCSWRRLLANRHSLPLPSLSLSEVPPSRCFGPPFLLLHRWRVASTKTITIHTALTTFVCVGGGGYLAQHAYHYHDPCAYYVRVDATAKNSPHRCACAHCSVARTATPSRHAGPHHYNLGPHHEAIQARATSHSSGSPGQQ